MVMSEIKDRVECHGPIARLPRRMPGPRIDCRAPCRPTERFPTMRGRRYQVNVDDFAPHELAAEAAAPASEQG